MLNFKRRYIFDVVEKISEEVVDVPYIPQDLLTPELLALARGEKKDSNDQIVFFDRDLVISAIRDEEGRVLEYSGTFTGSQKFPAKPLNYADPDGESPPKSMEEFEEYLKSLPERMFNF